LLLKRKKILPGRHRWRISPDSRMTLLEKVAVKLGVKGSGQLQVSNALP